MNALMLSVLFFLGVSILFYVLFGGADFGAGILELFLGKEKHEDQRKLISHAMAPVWEANHVWLILAVVIVFMGFPEIYTRMSTYLYLPLMAILVGIVARGCAFTFRHYDTLGKEYYRAYSLIFSLSSLWTSFFLGVTAGAMMMGRMSPNAPDFATAYIQPWLNLFCVSLGVFTCALFAFLASVYLIGEAKTNELRRAFREKAWICNIAVVISGAGVFVSADLNDFVLLDSFFSNPASLSCFILATLLWLPFWLLLRDVRHTVLLRALAALLVGAVMLGWFAVGFPIAGQTFQSAAAPDATLKALLGALVVGVLLIFPALAYLLKIFKWETIEEEPQS